VSAIAVKMCNAPGMRPCAMVRLGPKKPPSKSDGFTEAAYRQFVAFLCDSSFDAALHTKALDRSSSKRRLRGSPGVFIV